MINLTLRLTLGRILTLVLTDTGNTALHSDLVMLLKNLTLGLFTNANLKKKKKTLTLKLSHGGK